MISIDNEYLPETAPEGNVPGERPDVQKVYCEIIQLGACKIDNFGNEIGILNITVRPFRLYSMPQWLTKMTGMTAERRADGLSFPEALDKLKKFIGDDQDIWTFNGDWWVIQSNAKAHGIELPFNQPFQRLKPLLPEFGIDQKDFVARGLSEISSGGLHKVLDITLPEIEGVGIHDAAHDARSLAHSIYRLTKKAKFG